MKRKFMEIDIMLMNIREGLEDEYRYLSVNKPRSPITFITKGKLELLEIIESKIEDLKE